MDNNYDMCQEGKCLQKVLFFLFEWTEYTIDPVLDKQQGTRDRINQVSEWEKRIKLIWTLSYDWKRTIASLIIFLWAIFI